MPARASLWTTVTFNWAQFPANDFNPLQFSRAIKRVGPMLLFTTLPGGINALKREPRLVLKIHVNIYLEPVVITRKVDVLQNCSHCDHFLFGKTSGFSIRTLPVVSIHYTLQLRSHSNRYHSERILVARFKVNAVLDNGHHDFLTGSTTGHIHYNSVEPLAVLYNWVSSDNKVAIFYIERLQISFRIGPNAERSQQICASSYPSAYHLDVVVITKKVNFQKLEHVQSLLSQDQVDAVSITNKYQVSLVQIILKHATMHFSYEKQS